MGRSLICPCLHLVRFAFLDNADVLLVLYAAQEDGDDGCFSQLMILPIGYRLSIWVVGVLGVFMIGECFIQGLLALWNSSGGHGGVGCN